MTGNRRSDRALAGPPGNRAGDACVAKDDWAPVQGTKTRTLGGLPVRAPGCPGDCLPGVANTS